MLTKGHCYVSVTGTNALDYVDFYDFTQCVNELSIMCNELTTANEESGDGGYELVLPSGAVLGHRHIATYFRQRPTSKIVPKARLNKAPMYRSVLNSISLLAWLARCLLQITKRATLKFFKR